MTAYEFVGPEDTKYPWGVVHPGDIAYFAGRAPNGDWSEVQATPVVETTPPAELVDVPSRPNKAAPAADWVSYAKAEGSFPGDPETATRKAIVDHYTGGEQ